MESASAGGGNGLRGTPQGLRRDSAEIPQAPHQRLQLMSALLGALCCTLFCTSEALVHRFVRKRRQTFGTPMKHRCKYANKSTLYIALSMCAYQNLMERILFYSTGPQKTFGTPMKRTCKYVNMSGLPVCPVALKSACISLCPCVLTKTLWSEYLSAARDRKKLLEHR